MRDDDQVGFSTGALERRDQHLIGGPSEAGVDQERAVRADEQVLRHEPRAQVGLDPVDARRYLPHDHHLRGSGREPRVIV